MRHQNNRQNRCNRSNWVNYIDIYGKKFYLSFKGQETFKTQLGAVVTVIVCMVFLAYAAYSGTKLILKKDVSTVVNTYYEKIKYDNPEILNFEDYGFDFAVNVVPAMEEKYGKLIVEHRRYTRSKIDGARTQNITILELEKCGLNGLNYSDQEELKSKGIDNYFCLTEEAKRLTNVGGSYHSMDFQEVRVLIQSCENSTDSDLICASPEEMKEYFKPRFLEFLFIDKYFDLNDLDNSIKQTVNDLNFFFLDSDKFIMSRVYLVPTETQTFHSIFPFTFPNTGKFLSHQPLMNQYGDDEFYSNIKIIAYITIRLSDQKMTYYQTIFTLMDFLSVIGGLFKALYVMGSVFMDLYLSKMFYSDVLLSFFKIPSETKGQEEESVKQLLHRSEKVMIGDPLSNGSSKKVSYISKESLERQITQEVCSRKKFNFSFRDITSGHCRWPCLCRCGDKATDAGKKKERLFRKGANKFINQFDLLSLFSIFQQVRFLAHSLLTPEQRFLMKFQRKLVLDSESSDKEDDELEDIKSLTSNNPIEQLQFTQKVDKIVKKFVPNITKDVFDQKLIRKLFLKKNSGLREVQNQDQSIISPNLNLLMKEGHRTSNSVRAKKVSKGSKVTKFAESKFSLPGHLKKDVRMAQKKKQTNIVTKKKKNDPSESMRKMESRESDSS